MQEQRRLERACRGTSEPRRASSAPRRGSRAAGRPRKRAARDQDAADREVGGREGDAERSSYDVHSAASPTASPSGRARARCRTAQPARPPAAASRRRARLGMKRQAGCGEPPPERGPLRLEVSTIVGPARAFGDREAVEVRKLDVEQHDVGAEAAHAVRGLMRRRRPRRRPRSRPPGEQRAGRQTGTPVVVVRTVRPLHGLSVFHMCASGRALLSGTVPRSAPRAYAGGRPVAAISMSSWNDRSQSPSIMHLYSWRRKTSARLFGLGEDSRHIATIDADGVALAAIHGALPTERRAAPVPRSRSETTRASRRMPRPRVASTHVARTAPGGRPALSPPTSI